MNSFARRVSLAAACTVLVALASSRAACADAVSGGTPVIWCAAAFNTDAENSSDQNVIALQIARRALCSGDAAATTRALTALLPDMQRRYTGDGTHWIDFGRTYFYSLLATRQDDAARRFLNVFENGWKAVPEERAFWNGEYVKSFAGYVGDDGAVVRTPDMVSAHSLDPHLGAALADLKANDLDGAIREKLAGADTGSLYSLMLGNLYAQQRAWPQAFAAWVQAAAAGPGFAQPEFYTLDRWNESALEMIYYFRAHAPDRATPPG